MKKNKWLNGACVCALMILAAGCSNEEEVLSSGGNVVIHVKSTAAAIGGNASRATLADDAKTPNWETDDKIAAIVDEGDASELSLTSGAGTASGTFKGAIPSEGTKMYFYYPASAASGNVVDLTTQDGSNAKEMVMFASTDYSTTPSIEFQNKTSFLKLNIPVPAESGWNESTTDLYAIVMGAYSKGKLSKNGTWSDLGETGIKVSDIKVSDGMLTGYAAVIPGSKVTDLRIAVVRGTQGYITYNYTKTDAVVPENNVVTINRVAKKALLWTPGTTKANDVTQFLATGSTDLTIVATSEMGAGDFTELKNALDGKAGIALTLMNQNNLPYDALGNCKALKSVYAPDVTTVDRYCLKRSSAADVSFPRLKSLNVQILFGVSALQRTCFASLTDFTKASQELSHGQDLALGAAEQFAFAEGKNPLVIFQDNDAHTMAAQIAAGVTLYLNENGYEYLHNVSDNTWRGVTFKAIKTYAEFLGTATGGNPPSMGYADN